MSSWDELDEAVATITRYHDDLTVLQCTTEYPCPPEHVGLNILAEMRNRWGLSVGLSDHTTSNAAALAAVTMGATIIEKHFTLSKRMYGSDARNAAEPMQFAELVSQIREIEAILGNPVDKSDVSRYADMKEIFQKSVVSNEDISQGTTITRKMLGIKKPGTGMPPKSINEIVGTRAVRDLPKDSMITAKDIEIDC
jgi:N-acetylneuraminate synthase